MTDKPSPIDEYLATVPKAQRTALQELRDVIKNVVPDAQEVKSYGMPAFKFEGKVVAGFLAWANHLAYYPFSGSTLGEFAEELKDFKQTKSALHFQPDHPIPPDLVRRLIESRIAANRTKT
ncbi:MAG: DUF1801 domain-containing protein [Coriobacteriia bacterium]|nr:DUF1801 domain-containing protein [Coriobacteriia bacterium]